MHGSTEGLGSTEMLHIYLSNRLDDHRLGAAGARMPGYEVKLATPEGDSVRSGEEGVILVRGDSSAPRYWRKPEKSRETMCNDWIHTDDRFVERDGYYYFRGRTAGEDLGPVGLAARSGALPQRTSGRARVCRPRARAARLAHDVARSRASG